jgi:hypothetical protein
MGTNGMKDRVEIHFHISIILLPTCTPPTSFTELFQMRQRFLLDIVSRLHWHPPNDEGTGVGTVFVIRQKCVCCDTAALYINPSSHQCHYVSQIAVVRIFD